MQREQAKTKVWSIDTSSFPCQKAYIAYHKHKVNTTKKHYEEVIHCQKCITAEKSQRDTA